MAKKSFFFLTEWYLLLVLLLLCETSCPPQQQEQGLPAAVPGLATIDAKRHCCCCWCCSPVLLLLWFGHTHAHKNCASDLWVEGIQTTSRDTPAGCAASRPWHLPSRSDRAQTLRNTTSYILLQRGFTATPARCWAALYGVGCLSVRAAKAVSMCLSARHLSACLFHVSASGATIAAATANSRRLSQQNPYTTLCFIGRVWPNFPSFDSTFRKNPNKKVPQVWALCL